MSQANEGPGGAGRGMHDAVARQEIKMKVQLRLMETLDLVQAQKMPAQTLREECLRRVDYLLTELRTPLTTSEKQQLLHEVMDEIFGLGPIEDLLRDPSVSDVLVNGPSRVYVERMGRLELTDAHFRDDGHLLQVIQRIASRVGRRIDESVPMLDARLADGSRVNAIIPPLALQGPVMSVRRFAHIPIESETLIQLGTWNENMAKFMQAAVHCKLNILISGGTGTGKTTLLNVLSKWIPSGERVVTIEDAAELQLQREHVVMLETRPANIEGKGQITQRDLLRNSLRMRPDRIIIGEVRGAEAVDMLQAMNTGHDGSMTTVHANTVRDALRRVENMVSMAGMGIPVNVIRDQLAATIDIIIQVGRLTGGRRKVLAITEVTSIEKETILMQNLFKFRQTGLDPEGHALGHFETTGIRPQCLDRIEREGISLPVGMFLSQGAGEWRDR